MKQGITNNELRHKLNQTSVPDAAEGWEAMQSLLETTAAVRKRKTISLVIKRTAIAAVCLALIGLSTWQLLFQKQETNPPTQNTKWVNNPPDHTFHPDQKPTLPGRHKTPHTDNRQPVPKTDHPTPVAQNTQPAPAEKTPAHSYALPTIIHPKKASTGPIAYVRASRPAVQNDPLAHKPKDQYPRQMLAQQSLKDNQPDGRTERENRTFHISIKLKANGGASFGQPQQNFNPLLKGTPVDIYPAVYVSKRISDKVGIQAGLAVASPVDISNAHLNRSVPNTERGMVAMAAQTRDEFQISRLYYVDVPVTVQYHLSDRFTVGSGMQLSILEKIIGRRQRVDYDRYNMVMYAAPAEPVPTDLTGSQEAEKGIKPLDLRWLGTLKYRIAKRWVASFQLQYGLFDISDNQAFLYNHHDHNIVVSAGIGFVIK